MTIYIEDGNSSTTVFVVQRLVIYGEKDSASSIFTPTDGNAHLNLITCGGVWNKMTKSYSDRIVVFSDLVTK